MDGRILLWGCIAFSLLTGCDAVNNVFNSEQKKIEEAQEAVRVQREVAAESVRVSGEREALTRHVEASLKVLACRLAEADGKLRAAMEDQKSLSDKIRQLTARGDDGKLKRRSVILSDLLADEQVNALARKYLNCEFQLMRFEYLEKMEEALGLERNRDAAMRENVEMLKTELAAVKTAANAANAASQRSSVELRKEMEKLESRKRALNRRLLLTPATERAQVQREINEVMTNLRNLRTQYDSVRLGHTLLSDADKATRTQSTARDAALRRRKDADAKVMRQFSKLKTSSELTTDFEANTVGVLGKTITDVIDKAADEKRDLNESAEYLKSVSSGIDHLESVGIDRLRKAINARIFQKQLDK